MGEIMRGFFICIRNLLTVSGTNGAVSYYNIASIQRTGLHDWVDITQGTLGIIAALIAIIYGYYNIKLIRRNLKKND